jgi:hypothetical protein
LTNFINYLYFFQKFPCFENFPIFSFSFFPSLLHFFSLSSLLPPSCFLPHTTVCVNRTEVGSKRSASLPNAATPHGAPPLTQPVAPAAPLLSSPATPSPVSSPWLAIKLTSPAMAAHHGRPQPSTVFFMGQLKGRCTTSLLLSPPSILSETYSNLLILWDFVFQINSNFISNSNPNASRLLPHTYITLGAPPPCFPMTISPENQTLAATQVPPHHRCSSPPPRLFKSPPFKLNLVPVVRMQEANHRRKNHIETQYVASANYR